MDSLNADGEVRPRGGGEIGPHRGLELKTDGLEWPGWIRGADDPWVTSSDSSEGCDDAGDGYRLTCAEDLHDFVSRTAPQPVQTPDKMRRAICDEKIVAQRIEGDVDMDRRIVKKTPREMGDQTLRFVHVLAGSVNVGDSCNQRGDI